MIRVINENLISGVCIGSNYYHILHTQSRRAERPNELPLDAKQSR